MYSFITREDGGAGHTDDVVDVDDLRGDVAERCQADKNFFPRCWWATDTLSYNMCKVNSVYDLLKPGALISP